MIKGKEAYLKKLTSGINVRSVEVGREMEGTTPPSVFIGSWNYPKVYAGPMMSALHEDACVMDSPESWIPEGKTQEEIIGYRLNLVRGKNFVKVRDLGNRLVEKLQDISLSEDPVESEAFFGSKPKGASFSSHNMPHGPSALIERFDVGNSRWDRCLEKVYYDTDLTAREAVCSLQEREVPFSSIQKAFSTGTMGVKRRRCLVPTRWSITACDSTIGSSLLSEVRHRDILDTFRVHEFSSLNNYYAVLLMPTFWQYEWMEAFIHVLGREELIFSDHEHNTGKKGYSCVGGCYYSCKMAVLEALARERRQAGAIIFREAYPGYVPLGVFNVRENVRNAMKREGKEFEDMGTALAYINGRTHLPIERFIRQSSLLRDLLTSRQTTLAGFT